jgi:ferredoxin
VAGGHELCDTVVEFARTGVCYDGHLPGRCTDRLLRALPGSLADEKGAGHVFPFDFVTRSVTDAFLYRQYERARLYRDTGYCMGEKCRRCGACVDADERSAIVRRPRVPPIAATDVSIVAGLTREKARLPVLYVRARLPPFFGRTTPQWTGVCLLRLLLKARPDLIEDVLTVDDAVFGTGEAGDRFPILAGETVLAVKGWDPDALRVEFAGRIETDGGVEFGAPVQDFIPGRFQQAEIEFHQPAGSAETWVRSIREQGCVFTLRRDGTDRFLDIPRGKRSAGIVAARIREDDAGLKVCVTATPRLACRALLDRVEQDGGPVRAVCRRLTLT